MVPEISGNITFDFPPNMKWLRIACVLTSSGPSIACVLTLSGPSITCELTSSGPSITCELTSSGLSIEDCMYSHQVVHSVVQSSIEDGMCVHRSGASSMITYQDVPPLMITCVQVNRTQPRLLGPKGDFVGESLHFAGWIF